MERILGKVTNMLGSVGIAALAVAILLAPTNDLNAAAAGGPVACVNNCQSTGGNPNANPPTCTCGGTCDPTQGNTCTTCLPGTFTIGGVKVCTCLCSAK